MLVVLAACDEVEDVCSHRPEGMCDDEDCTYEGSTATCLQRCAEDLGCPTGTVCEVDSAIFPCPPEGGCLAIAYVGDVCRE